MTITKDKVVAIDYCLKDNNGSVLDSSEEGFPLEYLHGHNDMLPGLERELEGRKAEDAFDAVVEPEDGYGVHNDDLVMEVPRDNFPAGVEVTLGSQFEADGPEGPFPVTVVKIGDSAVTVDANHPLAGKRLFFTVKVVSVRDATEEEINLGLYHGCGLDDCGACGGGCGDPSHHHH